MKIGVLTFCSTEDNYGQVLQCYALQSYLNSMGHETYLIKYDASRNGKDLLWFLSLPNKILRRALSIVLNKKNYKIWQEFKEFEKLASEENRKHPRCFSKFKGQYIKSLPLTYNKKELYHTPPDFDIYIVGSDQVWGGTDPVYFLHWVSKGKKCIAYAPSFGGFQLSKTNSKILKFYLSKFDIVTVREKSGVDICKLLGREDVQLVLDPTFLLSKDDYRLLYKSTQTKPVNDYIFLYLLGNKIDFDIKDVFEWAAKYNLEVKYVSSQGRVDSFKKEYPTIEDWIQLIENAKYVITNSFHGMAFSIIMNTPFIVIPLAGSFVRMNGRIYDILSMLKLKSRVYKDNLDILLSEIDFSSVNTLLSDKREEIALSFKDWFGN